ncbi:hypothetical protein [Bifidobacterium pseudolongum]|uniref:hypothetical protein n=1 Tax=Bifidobacterium pseudolongum TaxID=1694 RepID=UPI0010E44ED9|nr:hypothetical protein [Bifidobacterium pseudolongum]RYQ00856.1 hypothetical protein PG22511B_0939 [Bifidobacterium pseudolongum subsp. globosum]
MTTLGFRYHILQNTDVPAPSRARMLEQTVSQWFAALAWSDWCVPSPMHGVRAQETAPFMSIAHLHAAGGSGSDFREFNIVSVDGKPFYRELRDDEHGANIYDEAIDRLWQTVQLLEMVARASHDAVSVDHGRTAIIFDEGRPDPFPCRALTGLPHCRIHYVDSTTTCAGGTRSNCCCSNRRHSRSMTTGSR